MKKKDIALGSFQEECKMKTLAKVQGRTGQLLGYEVDKVSVFSNLCAFCHARLSLPCFSQILKYKGVYIFFYFLRAPYNTRMDGFHF